MGLFYYEFLFLKLKFTFVCIFEVKVYHWLTLAKREHIRRAFLRAHDLPIKYIIANLAWQDSYMHNVVLHERLVNGWGKVWCVTLYLIRALGNSMEARFRHWLKNKKGYCYFLSHNSDPFLIIAWYKLAIARHKVIILRNKVRSAR